MSDTRSGARAAFLDRDGTIIVEKNYLADPDLVEFVPGAIEGLRLLRDAATSSLSSLTSRA
jgi:histidinol phosphatase-like enzyme